MAKEKKPGLYGSREQKKHAAKRRAQFALATAWSRIDYTEDVIKPELKAMAEGRAHLDEQGNYIEEAQEALEAGELPS